MRPLASHSFELVTSEHAAIVVCFVLIGALLIGLGRSHRGTADEVRFRRTAAVLMGAGFAFQQILLLLPDRWDREVSLPVHLCDLVWPVAAWALWTRHPVATAFVYFWGLTLSIQGILTPSLGNTYPELFYFLFWLQHLTIVWSAIYLTFGLGEPITWRTYRITVWTTVAWALFGLMFNYLADTNYGFLNRKPTTDSLLDLFGPWPLYLVVSIVVLAIGWAAMTWPWERRRHTLGVSKL